MALRRRLARGAVPRAAYTEWWWPPSPTIFRTIPAGYTSFEHTTRFEVDPGPAGSYLWAHEFLFVGGDAGHVGLQQGAGGRVAVLTIRNAFGGQDGGRVSTDDGPPGFSCRVPYGWDAGRSYRVRVWSEQEGWWSGAVRDEAGAETLIGSIRVPDSWRRLASWSRSSSGYRDALTRCADLTPFRVTFSVPTADGGTVEPSTHKSSLGDGTCDGTRVEDAPGGVVHAMGGG